MKKLLIAVAAGLVLAAGGCNLLPADDGVVVCVDDALVGELKVPAGVTRTGSGTKKSTKPKTVKPTSGPRNVHHDDWHHDDDLWDDDDC